ncbi:MAG: efflux transporter outer membrane subunit [Burkholderiaceae bacterium]
MAAVVIGLVTGCAITTPDPTPPRTALAWQSPLPHRGDPAAVGDWWQRLGDPDLPVLIAAAQRDNPNLAVAVARIEQARANARVAGAALVPRLDGNASASRAKTLVPPPGLTATIATATVDAAWELDLFGSARRSREAAVARVAGAEGRWHDGRVSLAAETAQAYVDLRLCEAVLDLYRQDLDSLGRSRALTARKVEAGFSAPADAALVEAGAAESSNRMRGQQTTCRTRLLTLSSLTGEGAAELQHRLGPRFGQLPQPATLAVTTVPAEALARRPDLIVLERSLQAASLEVGVAQAERFPRLRLSGSIGRGIVRAFDTTIKGPQWSIAPDLIVPLFDGGRSAALVDGANARFAEAMASYRAQARVAVLEIEMALTRIDGAGERLADAEQAAAAFGRYLRATQSRYETGAGSLFEQEEARRSTLNAGAALLLLRAEQLAAWITLYKGLGGDWQETEPDEAAP